MKLARRGAILVWTTLMLALTVKPRLASGTSKLCVASLSEPTALATVGNSRRPSSVSAIPRCFRTNRAHPRRRSKERTCWLIADCVRFNSAAAAVKLKRRAAHSKAENHAKGGVERGICINLAISYANVIELKCIVCQNSRSFATLGETQMDRIRWKMRQT